MPQLERREGMGKSPLTSRSQFVDSIYRIDRQIAPTGSAYFLKSLGRKFEQLVGDNSLGAVRYKGYWWRLHPHSELQKFLSAAILEGGVIKVGEDLYDSKKHGSRPFFCAWDTPVGKYNLNGSRVIKAASDQRLPAPRSDLR
jgi:hypothetical protein